MKLRLVWVGIAAFLVALITVLPVRWVAGLLPPQVRCANWTGSVWRGQCRGLSIQQSGSTLDVDALRWTLHPASLLRLMVKADFDIRTAQGTGSGSAEIGRNGRMAIQNVAVNALFDRRLATMLAPGWAGKLETTDLTMKLQGNTLLALSGGIGLRDFHDGNGTALGSYRLVFPRSASSPFHGTLTDIDGPLEVKASVTINADRRWQLEGLITPRPEAAPSLRSRLDILGAPDASGRYRLASEGTFK